MAFTRIKAAKDSYLGLGRVEAVAVNSLDCQSGMFLKDASGFIDIAGAGDSIIGASSTEKVFSSSNETIEHEKVNYVPTSLLKSDTFKIEGIGQLLTVVGFFVATNTIDLKVNGVVMTQVLFSSDHAGTMAALILQLNTQFAALATFTITGTHAVTILPKTGNNGTVVISNIVIGGSTPPVMTYSLLVLDIADRHAYFDLSDTQYVNLLTQSSSTGQLLCEDALGMEFSIANV